MGWYQTLNYLKEYGMNVTTLAQQINETAAAYRVGNLQQFRSQVHGKHARTKKIFTKSTVFEDEEYAFHDGGRTELQFNIGYESCDQGRCWRHGVAFSFERSHTLPNPFDLRDKVKRFNEWVPANGDALRGFRMWTWDGHIRSADYSPGEIPTASIRDEAFVFLGARVLEDKVDVNNILRDFDRLYPLYAYVESGTEPEEVYPQRPAPKSWAPTARHTTVSLMAGQIERDLRHNVLQQSLLRTLEAELPDYDVYSEWEVSPGGRVDVAMDTNDGLLFCEIKVAPHVRAAVREAVGQLLEYTHWPAESRASKWWVVSEGKPSAKDVAYLKVLRTRYGLPIFYRQIDAEKDSLGPEI
jgi:hypothetical protein